MRNRFEVDRDVARIELIWKGQRMETVVDVEDLERVSSIRGRWFAQFDQRAKKFYVAASKGNNGKLRLQRFLLSAPAGFVVDHINRDTLDNRKSNLRIVTNEANRQNLGGAFRNNRSSGIRGIHWHKGDGAWQVTVGAQGKHFHIGKFRDIEDAKIALVAARKELQPFSQEAQTEPQADSCQVCGRRMEERFLRPFPGAPQVRSCRLCINDYAGEVSGHVHDDAGAR